MDRKLRGMRKLVSVLVILCMLTSLAAVTGPVLQQRKIIVSN